MTTTTQSTPSGRVFIPYFGTDDSSQRPLPPAVTAWLCSYILVDGVPFPGTPLVHGDTLTLSVVTGNSGDKPLYNVLTRIWWGDPSVGISRGQLTLIAEQPLGGALVPGQTATGLTAPWLVTPDVPEHVCLVAQVSHDQDPAPDPVTPGLERHFAQHNLQLHDAAPGAPMVIAFQALILPGTAGQSVIQAQPTRSATLLALVPIIRAQATPLQTGVQLTNLGPVPPGQAVAWEARFTVPGTARPGQILALDLTETLITPAGSTAPVGGITVLVRVGSGGAQPAGQR